MSEFSGKCDFFDWIDCRTHDEEWFKKTEIYIGKNVVPLKIESLKDAVPYYPHLVGVAVCNNGKQIIRISEESYVDRQERELIDFNLKACIREYNRCKRTGEDYLERMSQTFLFGDSTKEIAERVKEYGKKADVSDIHTPMCETYRKALYEEMLKYGWDESVSKYWVYGGREWKK